MVLSLLSKHTTPPHTGVLGGQRERDMAGKWDAMKPGTKIPMREYTAEEVEAVRARAREAAEVAKARFAAAASRTPRA